MTITEIKKKLKKSLNKDRYEHTMGVMYTAASLAMAHEYDIDKAMLAGLLHDCAKCLSSKDKIKLCEDNHVLISPIELENPGLLHAKAGAELAKLEYEIEDPLIISAISCHTTGKPNMNLLEKIIFVSDYIEPGRCEAPRLDFLRKIAFKDINWAVAEILYDTINYLNKKSGAIDPTTQMTYDFYSHYRKDI